MATDPQGLTMTAASDAAAAGYDDVVEAFLKYRADAGQRLKATMALDPAMPMGLVMGGVFFMLAYNTALVPRARAAAEAAARHAGTDRERAHAAALAHWAEGEIEAALGAWEAIMAVHPHDILAFRLHHYCAFWLGRAGQMLRAVDAVAPPWSAAMPGYGSILACRCFANEECGNYQVAEEAGRAAVTLDPATCGRRMAWRMCMEMQGRRGEGIAWLKTLRTALGRRLEPAAPPVVAPRHVSPGTRRA